MWRTWIKTNVYKYGRILTTCKNEMGGFKNLVHGYEKKAIICKKSFETVLPVKVKIYEGQGKK